PKKHNYDNRLRGELSFDYDGAIVSADESGRGTYQPERRRLVLRDEQAENQAAALMRSVGFRLSSGYYDEPPAYELNPSNLPAAIRRLTAEGWHVEADGHLYRQ